MKKVLVIALMLGAGLAYASSLGVPWFVDNAATGTNSIPAAPGDLAIIFLHNNSTDDLLVTIEYYTSTGISIGPYTPDNEFTINANSSLAFRPYRDDSTVESIAARAIPNRPPTEDVPVGNDGKKNGSIVFTWTGPTTDLTGSYVASTNVKHPISDINGDLIYKLTGYGHLLPAGSSG